MDATTFIERVAQVRDAVADEFEGKTHEIILEVGQLVMDVGQFVAAVDAIVKGPVVSEPVTNASELSPLEKLEWLHENTSLFSTSAVGMWQQCIEQGVEPEYFQANVLQWYDEHHG